MGTYTDHIDTDEQKLKPAEAAKLQKRVNNMMPYQQKYLVVRKVICSRRSDEDKTGRRFDILSLEVTAANKVEALLMADDIKYGRERDLGHHSAPNVDKKWQ